MNPLGAASVAGGRFRLVEPVRNGDPDGAWRAVDEDSGAEVAIKPLGAYLAGDAVAQARFRHAARAVLPLSGPGIARVHDYGESSLPGARIMLYLVRDLVSGHTLDQRLAEGPLPAAEAVEVAASVAAALEAAHQAGVAHGHLVPANIVLGAGSVTVTDFGLPAARNGCADARTGLSYLPPELGQGSPATPAADMYALGVIFVACLAGIGSAAVRPGATAGHGAAGAGAAGAGAAGAGVTGNGATGTGATGTGAVTAPSALALEPVPAAIAALWASCLGPDPSQRPTAARAVALSRQVLPSRAPAGASPAGPAPAGPAPAASQPAHPSGPHPVGSTRQRRGPQWAHDGLAACGELATRGLQAARGGLATRGRRMAGAGAAAALIAVVAAGSFLVSSLNARPAAHISSATGTPSTAAPSTSTHPGSAPATGAPGTDGNGQSAPPPASTPAASPVSLPSASALAAIQQLGASIREDVAAGQMRPDVGLDMDNLILPVMTQLASGQAAPVQQLVSTLRVKIATRLGEDGLTTQAAAQLNSDLDALQRSTGTGS